MGWATAAVALVLAFLIVQLIWQSSPATRKAGSRRGTSWYRAPGDTTEPTSTPSYGDQDHTETVPTRSIRLWSVMGVMLAASVPLIWLILGGSVLVLVAGVLAGLYLAKAFSAWHANRLIERYRSIGEAATKRFESR